MQGRTVQDIVDRVNSFRSQLATHLGTSFSYSALASEGRAVHYTIVGVQSPSDYQALVATLGTVRQSSTITESTSVTRS
ncbi:MAG: hypothetical protein L6Q99_21740 [Planctomycetes bacterium]|nr:hypothetical protein [Planctomycetota bacterium]